MQRSESIKSLAAALSAFQGDMKSAAFNKVNPHFRNRYCDLTGLWDAARATLAKHKLAVVQSPQSAPDKGGIIIETMVLHESGEYLSDSFLMPSDKPTAQGYGSAITYGRRYALASMLGLVSDEDDDGNDATGNDRKAAAPKPKDAIPNKGDIAAALKARGVEGDNIRRAVEEYLQGGKFDDAGDDVKRSMLAAIGNGELDKFKTAK